MTAGRLDLTIEQGATFRRTITLEDAEGTRTDFTGYALRAYIRETYSDASELARFTVYANVDGNIIMELTAIETAALESTCNTAGYVYDLEAEDGAGDVMRILQGRVNVSPEATK